MIPNAERKRFLKRKEKKVGPRKEKYNRVEANKPMKEVNDYIKKGVDPVYLDWDELYEEE